MNSLEMFNRPPETDNVIFLCHACSDLKCQAGEACVIIAPEEEKDTILQGRIKCLQKYTFGPGNTVEEFEREFGYSPLLAPEFFDFETDFYIVASEEARQNYRDICTSELWSVSFSGFRPLSNEETLWKAAEEQIHEYRRIKRQAKREIKARLDAFEYICQLTRPGVICRNDPIRAGWRA